MRKIVNLFRGGLMACLSACALQPGGSDGGVTAAPDASVSGRDASASADAWAVDAASIPDAGYVCDAPMTDAAAPVDAAPSPDARPPDTHLIYCSALNASGGRIYEFRGNLKTGMVDNAPSWAPGYLGYGSDYNGYGWPGNTPNPATNIGTVAVTNGGATWTVAPWTFTSLNAVQGFTPYVASGSEVKWLDIPGKWTIAPNQYCAKSPSRTKLCSCNSLPCTPANAVNAPNCVN